jgi:hypothetical protein
MKGKILITFSFILFSVIANSQNHAVVNPIKIDDSFDGISDLRLQQAVIELERIFNSEEFAQAVLHENFKVGNYGLSSSQIYDLIVSGVDNYKDKPKDYSIDLRVKIFDEYFGHGNFGVTDMNTRVTRTHRCYILQNDLKCYISHLAHEYMHQIGFLDNRSFQGLRIVKTNSVPYKIGNIVGRLISEPKNCHFVNSTCTKQSQTLSEVSEVINANDSLIASCFSQGAANNCASIALIKAAMLKYGYSNIFEYKKEGSIHKVKLKDGTNLEITDEELSLVSNKYAKFEITRIPEIATIQDNVIFYAHLAYAAIAKNIVKNGYWGCGDNNIPHYTQIKKYEDALIFISRTSYCTDNCFKLLGYKIKEGKIYDFNSANQLRDKGIILYSWAHAVVVYNKQIDCHGEWLSSTTGKVCGNRFQWYIVLE